MRKIFRLAAVLALTACGGDGGRPGITDPEITFAPPAASDLVRDAIPYDSLGGTTIHFHRWLGGDLNGYVRLVAATRAVSVYGLYGTSFWPAVSGASSTLAYRGVETVSGSLFFIRAGVFVRPLGGPKSAEVRLSGDDDQQRSGPAWSSNGQLVYYIEGPANPGVSRIIRQSPVAAATDKVVIATLPRACDVSLGGNLSVTTTGDVAVSQLSVGENNACVGQLLRWRSADQSLTVIAQYQGLTAVPAWSLDGSRLALLTRSGGRVQIRVMSSDGSNPVIIYDSPATLSGVSTIDESMCWSGDGSRIIFSHYSADYLSRIYSIRPNGTGLTAITAPVPVTPPAGVMPIAADGTLSCTP